MALCLALPADAAGKWTRLRSANFEFVGDAGEGDIRRTAQHLEQFREVLSRALPTGAVTSSVPTIVIVFKNDGLLAPYKPRFQGRPVELAGFFQGGAAVNYIVVNAAARDSGLKTIYHEYAHFLTGNTAGRVPVWVNEGLAGFYETFEERDGGKSALIGVPRRDYLLLLQNSTLMPLVELLAVGHDSPSTTKAIGARCFTPNRGRSFIIDAWESEARGAAAGVLTNLKGDASPDAAFRDAFGVTSTRSNVSSANTCAGFRSFRFGSSSTRRWTSSPSPREARPLTTLKPRRISAISWPGCDGPTKPARICGGSSTGTPTPVAR